MSKHREERTAGPSSALVVAALVAIAIAVFASGMLVYQHFTAASLPGCGPGSGCAKLGSSVWGKVPGLGLPVSFVGLAWFVAAAIGWVVGRSRGPAPLFVWLTRLGAAASLLFIVVMISMQSFCLYCVLAHTGNLLFWIIVERTARASEPIRLQPVATALTFVVAAGSLFAADRILADQIQKNWEKDLAESGREIVESIDGRTWHEDAFTGRYRQGPEEAAIRIVILSDYQCPDCRRIEMQARQVLAGRDDVSVSAKHFPMCNQCNPHMGQANPHPNACWAARAAEAAGILRGNDGFWEMHHLLFDRKGSFTNPELMQMLADLGYDQNEFVRVMSSQETLDLVQADIEEGKALGLHFTPMIFVNGVELKGYMAPEALTRMVEQVTAGAPPLLTAHYDAPPVAAQKYIDDWAEKRVSLIRGLDTAWTRGNPAGPVHIVIWSDLMHRLTADLQGEVEALIAKRGDVRYTFRQYPVDTACNTRAQNTLDERACLAARAAEAAGLIAGNDGYWKMHDWILANQATFSEQAVLKAVPGLGFDTQAFQGAMATSAAEVEDDLRAASSAGVNKFIPAVYVNGKWVPRWRLEGADILGRICEQAAAEAAGTGGAGGAAPAGGTPPR